MPNHAAGNYSAWTKISRVTFSDKALIFPLLYFVIATKDE
jgi:hypothetical protein